jgi:pimeloyl-ACP methyl ester carboxylesterase
VRPVLQFSHGNGFPASSYQKMLDGLAGRFEIHAVERIGHDSAYPVTDNWPHLERELIAAIERQHQPVCLLGHSLGGLLSIAVALARPELVRAVVILDAPVLASWRAWMFRLLKLSGRDARFSPAAATLKRRVEFDSLEAARAHFRSKQLFARLDDEVLTDYLGRPADPALPLRLSFDAAIEARIYRTIPHTLAGRMRRGSKVPIGFLAGTRSAETRLVGLSAAQALVGQHLQWIDGSHLFPLERPLVAARAVDQMFQRLLGPDIAA